MKISIRRRKREKKHLLYAKMANNKKSKTEREKKTDYEFIHHRDHLFSCLIENITHFDVIEI